jgi:hypothetical protein
MENLITEIYHHHLATEGSGVGQYNSRELQFPLPDFTSPPLQLALKLTPKPYRQDSAVQSARDLDAVGGCSIDGNRCQIPFPVIDFSEKFRGRESGVGVIFYNGGFVDPRAYSPIATILNDRYGIPVVLPIFSADLAFTFGQCDTNRLDFAKAEFPEVEKWVLAGHSFGGIAAFNDLWSRLNTMDDSAAGLALLASDVGNTFGCGDTDFSDSNIPMAQVLGTNDEVQNRTRAEESAVLNTEDGTFFADVFGANHASFGAYDFELRGTILGETDGEQLVPSNVVWDIAAAAIANVAARTGAALPKPKVSKRKKSGKKS